MIDKQYLIPHINDNSLSEILYKEETDKHNTHIDMIKNPSNAVMELQGYFIGLYKNKIKYSDVQDEIQNIIEAKFKEDKNFSAHFDILEVVFEIELLRLNFYERMCVHYKNSTLFKKCGLEIVDLVYPHYELKENSCDIICGIARTIIDNPTSNIRMLHLSLSVLWINQKLQFTSLSNDLYYSLLIDNDNYIKQINEKDLDEKINSQSYYIKPVENLQILLQYLQKSDTELIKSTIKKYKSPRLIDAFLKTLINDTLLIEILCEINYKNDTNYVLSIFNKIFIADKSKGEYLIKKYIISTRNTSMSSMFFENCNVIDSDFIEVCIICVKDIKLLSMECLLEIVDSHYFSFLTIDYEIFLECVKKIVNNEIVLEYEKVCERLFKNVVWVREDDLRKVLTFLEHFPEARVYFVKYLFPFLESLRLQISAENNIDRNGIITMSERYVLSEKSSEYFYRIVNELRCEEGICKFIDLFVEMNFKQFIEQCLFYNIKIFDIFMVNSVNIILDKVLNLEDQNLFLNELQKHANNVNQKSFYWNIIAQKLIKGNKMENIQFGKNEIPNEKKFSNPFENAYNVCPFQNNSQQDTINKLKFTENFYSCDLLIDHLERELKAEDKNYELIESILKTLQKRNNYKQGLTFYDSEIYLEEKIKNFSFYGIYYQYETQGKQMLFKIENDKSSCEIGLDNGKLYKCITYTSTSGEKSSDTSYLKENNEYTNTIFLGIKYTNETLILHFNDTKHKIIEQKCNSIRIGKDFKGVISKLLFYENCEYDKKFLNDKGNMEYYVSFLSDLEKSLIFRNERGFFISNLLPYYFSKKMDVRIRNVIINENINWLEDDVIRNMVLDLAIKDARMKEILDKYISSAILNLE